MILKFVFLVAALALNDSKKNPYTSTLLYVVPIFIAGYFVGALHDGFVMSALITLCLAFVYFALLTKFHRHMEYFVIMVVGGMLLIMYT